MFSRIIKIKSFGSLCVLVFPKTYNGFTLSSLVLEMEMSL